MSAVINFMRRCETMARKGDELRDAFDKAVQELVDRHGVKLATGHLSNIWQIAVDGKWVNDSCGHPIFDDLARLEDACEAGRRVGPSNMEYYEPTTGDIKS